MTENPSILHHVSVGVRDIARARAFYDAALAPLGIQRVMDVGDVATAWGKAYPEFWVGAPEAGGEASPGSGVHIALIAPDAAAVDAFHAAGLAHGGSDAGAPGPRPDYGPAYYAAFLRDPEGNKIEAAILPPEDS